MQLPKLPRGSVIPTINFISDTEKIINESKAKKQRRHDYKIAFIGIVGGFISGFLSSMLVYLITHQC